MKTNHTINLDKYFRRDSVARQIAERLLTGETINRQEVSQALDVSVTSVNRVVGALEEAGAKFRRDLDGRQATFRLVSVGDPRRKKEYPPVGAEARIVGLEMLGDTMMVTFDADNARFRGAMSNLQQPPLSKGEVTGVNKEGANVLVTLSISGKTVRLLNVHNVAATDR
jgi:predicted ArsR family transcriptional regulator